MAKPIKVAALLVLLAFPFLELGLLFRASRYVGGAAVVLIIAVSAILGAIVIRRTGFSVVTNLRAGLEAGRGGFQPLLDGLVKVAAGILLISPGLISDMLGLLLMLPPVRDYFSKLVLPRLFETISSERPLDPDQPRRHPDSVGRSAPMTIEGEYERIGERPLPPDPARL